MSDQEITPKRRGRRPAALAPVTEKNFEKRITDVYYRNAVPMLEEAMAELRRLAQNPEVSDVARLRACEMILTATRIIKNKDSVVQVGVQINNRGGAAEPTASGQSFESIIRRLDARDDVIDVTPVQ
jgi:hypothetical protein